MTQPTLFDAPEPEAIELSGRKTFLTQNARVFSCLAESRTLTKLVAQAARKTARKHGTSRSAATPFEDAVKALILEESAAAAIAQETMDFYAERHPDARDLVKVELADGPKKKDPLADLLVRFRFDRERTVTVATNIKRLAPRTTRPEGGSLLSVVRLATEPGYDPADPPQNQGFNFERGVVEWFAGRRKILDGRDYWLLVCRVGGGKLVGLEAWGVLAGVDAQGRPVMSRHPSRAVVEVYQPSGALPASMDINAEISRRLLPGASTDALRAQLVALALERDGDEAARALAGRLLDVADNDLIERLLTAINRD